MGSNFWRCEKGVWVVDDLLVVIDAVQREARYRAKGGEARSERAFICSPREPISSMKNPSLSQGHGDFLDMIPPAQLTKVSWDAQASEFMAKALPGL
jgi:hypothetical protein